MDEAWLRKAYSDPRLLKLLLREYGNIVEDSKSGKDLDLTMMSIVNDITKALKVLGPKEHKAVVLNCVMGVPEHKMMGDLGVKYQNAVNKIVKRGLWRMIECLQKS